MKDPLHNFKKALEKRFNIIQKKKTTGQRHGEKMKAELSLEQQFKLEVLKEDAKKLTKEQAQDYLIEIFRQMMVKDNLMRDLMKGL